MGQEQPPPAHRPSMENNIIQMRMQCKALGRAAKKAEKQSTTYQKKAKDALKKNNEEAAKMYLMSAASKTKQAQNCERTSMKMEFMVAQVKSMKNNEKFMNSFSALTQAANQSMNNFDAATMSNQMQIFNNRMDELMINNKMMTQIMDTNQPQTDAVVDQMKEALQQQILMQQKNKLLEQERVIYEKQKAQSDKFLDQLKDL